MKRWLLDTSALLTLRDDEPGAERVAELLHPAQQGKAECLVCFMTGTELLCPRLAHEQCLALPIQWVHESPELLLRAAELKASCPLSLVDAWIAASALEANAILVHKDPEFDVVPVAQEPLPFKRPW